MMIINLFYVKSENSCCSFIIVIVNTITRAYKIYLKSMWNLTY